MAAVPPSLKSIKPYVERAAELRSKDPIVAYHCGLYALQEAMKLRAQLPKEDMGFVIGLMDQLEAEKGTIGEMDTPAILVENFAQDLFQRADDNDRAGNHDMRTGKAFLVASQLIEVCKQFGELADDLAEKSKYAKWRFVEIAKATKAGTTPPPPRGDPDPPAEETNLPPADAPPMDLPPPPETPADGAYGLPPVAPAPTDPAGGLPSYMGLPAAPPPAAPAPAPAVHAPAAPAYSAPAYPPAAPAPAPPPQYAGAPGAYGAPPPQQQYMPPPPPQQQPLGMPPMAPPGMPGMPGGYGMPGATMPVAAVRQPSFKPDRYAICEAQRLCSSASSALQFSDHDTAVHQLTQALQMLTQPRPQAQQDARASGSQ